MQAHSRSGQRIYQAIDLLPPEPRPRRTAGRTETAHGPVEDAVFEVIGPSNGRFERDNDNRPAQTTQHGQRLLALSARAAVRLAAILERWLGQLSPQAFMTLIGAAFFLVFWICGGFSVIASAPVLAQPEPLRVEDAFADIQDASGMQLLALGGFVVNSGRTDLKAPVLLVMSEGRSEPLGRITLDRSTLAKGTRIPFSARLKVTGGKFGRITIIPRQG